MSGLGYVIGGALQGLGGGIVAQGQQRAEAQAASAKQRFEMWLSDRQHDQALEKQDNAGAIDRQNAGVSHGYKIKEMESEYGLRDRNDARGKARDVSATLTIEQAKTSNEATIARLKSSLKMTEDQASAANDMANKVTLARQEIGHSEIAADGSMVLYSKTGQLLLRSKAGVFTPKATDTPLAMPKRESGTLSPRPALAQPPSSSTLKFDAKGNLIG